MAPLTYIDCLNCQGRGYHFVTGYTSRYDNRAPTEPCTYCSGRGWVNIMQKDEECSTCGGYGWGKVGEHAVAFLKGVAKREDCATCHGTGRKQPQEGTMEKKAIDVTTAIAEGHVGIAAGFPQKNKDKEVVIHPSHYNVGKIEVIDAIEDWKLGFNDGNAVKYIARHRMKNSPQADLEKALWYVARELMKAYGVSEQRVVDIVQTCVKETPGTR